MGTPQLAVIGGGNMAQAILLGAFDAGALDPAGVVVAEPDGSKRRVFTDRGALGVADAGEALPLLGPATQILLAVKPQVFPEVAAALGGVGDRVVISIMAGVTSAAIREQLGGAARVVRTMPNTPAQIGKGVTAVTIGAGAGAGDDALAQNILGSVGQVVAIEEGMLDAFTGVVGSGPAYVFAMAEAMIDGAERVGFDAALADRIVRGTIEGAAGLLASDERSAGDLRQAVTSRGGTTAAGLAAMADGGFHDAVASAVVAARDRGAELGRG